MLCPTCEKDSPEGNIFCVHCGGNLDLSYAAVKLANKEKNLLTRNEEITYRTRVWMRISFILLAACVSPWFFRPSPPRTYAVPAYPAYPLAAAPAVQHEGAPMGWTDAESPEGLAVVRPMTIVPLTQQELRQPAPAPYEIIPPPANR
jgi:hypothetical protein